MRYQSTPSDLNKLASGLMDIRLPRDETFEGLIQIAYCWGGSMNPDKYSIGFYSEVRNAFLIMMTN